MLRMATADRLHERRHRSLVSAERVSSTSEINELSTTADGGNHRHFTPMDCFLTPLTQKVSFFSLRFERGWPRRGALACGGSVEPQRHAGRSW